jgi:hypothetical protein
MVHAMVLYHAHLPRQPCSDPLAGASAGVHLGRPIYTTIRRAARCSGCCSCAAGLGAVRACRYCGDCFPLVHRGRALATHTGLPGVLVDALPATSLAAQAVRDAEAEWLRTRRLSYLHAARDCLDRWVAKQWGVHWEAQR